MNELLNVAKVTGLPRVSMRALRVRSTLAQAFAAFTTGARLIPMGDNGKLLRSLAAKSTDR